MNNLQIFDYNNKMVRTIETNNEFWWVLKDVCKVLGISKYRDTANRLDNDERETLGVDTLGGEQKMLCVNESGLYNVILRSDKPEAKPFRKWITSEVLPSIRKTGSYSVNTEDNNINSQVLDLLKIQQEQVTNMFSLITAQFPKQYTPHWTHWIGKTYEKIDKLADNANLTRKQMLRSLYNEFQDTYDIDLNEYQYNYCILHNIENTGIYTMNVIGADIN